MLHSPHFSIFTKYVEVSTFVIAHRRLRIFKELLTRLQDAGHGLPGGEPRPALPYESLLNSDKLRTRRQSLKLLPSSKTDTTLCWWPSTRARTTSSSWWTLTRKVPGTSSSRPHHVFKVFVAIPINQTYPRHFLRNQEKLIDFLSKFLQTRGPRTKQFQRREGVSIKQSRSSKPLPEEPEKS